MRSNPWPLEPHASLARYWKARHGEPVRRVLIDAGFSCPNRDGTVGRGGCTFCDPASFSPAAGDRRPVSLQLLEGVKRLRTRGVHKCAAYFQPHTNTHASIGVLQSVWDEVLPFHEVVALCIGTRPDSVPDLVLDLLATYRQRWEVWLELGLQTACDRTLDRLNRGHTAADFADATRRARARGLQVCAHVILGLPGEGPEEEGETARFLAELEVDGVKVHHLAVVRGTPLEGIWRKGEVGLLAEAEYAARAAAFVAALPPGTVLHRLVGDTAPDRLLAPHYDKARVLQIIRSRLAGEGCRATALI